MNFFQIISEIEKVDPEVYDRLDSRRSVFKHMSGLGQKLTAAALPLAVGAIFNKAYAQTPVGASVNDVLNFALKLEYLESYFYQARMAVVGGFNTNVTASLALIATDEANHVTFLRSVLGSNAIAAPTAATFDYTAKGAFNPTVAAQYLALAQSFEDTGVRAYKGAAPLVMSNKTVLTAALNIHSVEARHSSQLRAIRRSLATSGTPAPSQGIAVAPYSAAPKSWISGTDGGGAVPGATDAIYGAGNNTNAPTGITFDSEANITQGNVALSGSTITAAASFPTSAFSEAFDEGLDVGTVAKIANMFSVSGNYFG
ncbi:ferritin-like domain-containing protein [Hymenobacter sp. BRD128]|uniref:ferritin-like domain-containing protein n=1 Tax=Hymenobacter sp. BRD128 TaxID=2675878 RepID=UPI001563CCE8|nr:ferritin-like domain-containing protein [Hymenobacter sp. BRD128]QKG57651.1 ferritin-like domain-containing protein [Hymenobacter sp. BRD128]